MRATRAVIDLKAIQNNLAVIRLLAPKSKVMAVVKADAYGHGISKVATALAEADAFAVACLEEALTLRQAGIERPIVLLEGFFEAQEIESILEFNLQTVVHQQRQVDEIIQAAQTLAGKPNSTNSNRKLTVWLKLDSGMNRLGFTANEIGHALEQLQACPMVARVNLMSHLACADEISNPMNRRQISLFNQFCFGQTAPRSMANSAAVIAWPESHFDWVRPGIALYGCSPLANYSGSDHHLHSAMTLQSQLFAIHKLAAGESVGYGASWRSDRATRIGVVAIGYGDGYPRHAKQGTPVWINGRTYPLVGQVSMDMLTVDLGTEGEANLGDRVVLWGSELPVETIATYAGTIPYTLLCGVTSRVKFEWHS